MVLMASRFKYFFDGRSAAISVSNRQSAIRNDFNMRGIVSTAWRFSKQDFSTSGYCQDCLWVKLTGMFRQLRTGPSLTASQDRHSATIPGCEENSLGLLLRASGLLFVWWF